MFNKFLIGLFLSGNEHRRKRGITQKNLISEKKVLAKVDNFKKVSMNSLPYRVHVHGYSAYGNVVTLLIFRECCLVRLRPLTGSRLNLCLTRHGCKLPL